MLLHNIFGCLKIILRKYILSTPFKNYGVSSLLLPLFSPFSFPIAQQPNRASWPITSAAPPLGPSPRPRPTRTTAPFLYHAQLQRIAAVATTSSMPTPRVRPPHTASMRDLACSVSTTPSLLSLPKFCLAATLVLLSSPLVADSQPLYCSLPSPLAGNRHHSSLLSIGRRASTGLSGQGFVRSRCRG